MAAPDDLYDDRERAGGERNGDNGGHREADDERSWEPLRLLPDEADREQDDTERERIKQLRGKVVPSLALAPAAPEPPEHHDGDWQERTASAELAQERACANGRSLALVGQADDADDTTAQEDARGRQADAEESQRLFEQIKRLLARRPPMTIPDVAGAVFNEATGQTYAQERRESKVRAIIEGNSRGPHPAFVRAVSGNARKGQHWTVA